MSLEMWYKRLKQKRGIGLICLQASLTLPSLIFRSIVRFRHMLYDHGFLKQKTLPAPVISVGNLVAGGTGKTPITIEIAKRLTASTCIGILSRGYRSQAEFAKVPVRVNSSMSAEQGGDEAVLIARHFPESIVFSGRDRIKSGMMAIDCGAKILLLDDGMQFKKLHRDTNVVIIDGAEPFGGGHFLPRGFLRDDPKQLAKATLIVIQGTLEEIRSAEKAIEHLTQAPIVGVTFKSCFCDDAISLEGLSVGVFCGIGKPYRFVEDIERLGARVVATRFSSDHGMIDSKQFRQFVRIAETKGAKLLLCTEKDYVKNYQSSSLPIKFVSRRVDIVKNREAWEAFFNRLLPASILPKKLTIEHWAMSKHAVGTNQTRRFHEAMA